MFTCAYFDLISIGAAAWSEWPQICVRIVMVKSINRVARNLLRDQRGAILVITTAYLPVIVGFFSLAVDMAYVYKTRTTLQITADAAALAAVSYLPDSAASCTI